jgi:signal transduction histidine kinase
VEIKPIIDKVMELVLPSVQEGVQLFKRVYLLPSIIENTARITQMLYNIISNACAATKQGFVRIGTCNGRLSCCRHETVDLKAIIDNVMELALPSVQEGVQLLKRVYLLPSIIGDTARITLMLYNIISNACTATKQGIVRVGAGYDSDQDEVFLYVLDTGKGMDRRSLVEAFGQSRSNDGLPSQLLHNSYEGLGLQLVTALAAAHRCGHGNPCIDWILYRKLFVVRLHSKGTGSLGRLRTSIGVVRTAL